MGHAQPTTTTSTSTVLKMVAVASLAALLGALLTRTLLTPACADPALSFPQREPEWDMVNKLDVPEKGVRVTRLMSSDRCYIMPQRSSGEQARDRAQGRPLALIDDALSADMVEHMAGPDAVAFCRGYATYALRDLQEDMQDNAERPKRDASYAKPPPAISAPPVAVPAAPVAAANAPPSPAASVAPVAAPAIAAAAAASAAPAAAGNAALSSADLAAKVPELTGPRAEGDGIFGGAKLPGKPVAQIALEQRTPRCHKIVLDCPNMVGQVQSCFTWQNGRIWMDRQCKDPNTFVVRMTKPPGRILKVAQQESILCLQLHRQNKDC